MSVPQPVTCILGRRVITFDVADEQRNSRVPNQTKDKHHTKKVSK